MLSAVALQSVPASSKRATSMRFLTQARLSSSRRTVQGRDTALLPNHKNACYNVAARPSAKPQTKQQRNYQRSCGVCPCNQRNTPRASHGVAYALSEDPTFVFNHHTKHVKILVDFLLLGYAFIKVSPRPFPSPCSTRIFD